MNFYALEKHVRIVEHSFHSMMIRYLKITLCVGNADRRTSSAAWSAAKSPNAGAITPPLQM